MKSHRGMLICLFLAALVFLTACGKASQPAAQPAEETEAVVEPVETAEPTPEPTPVPATPEGRAAALGLPAPPDIDIDDWKFVLANYYNSVGDVEIGEYGGFEGQGFHAKACDDLNDFVTACRAAGHRVYAAVAYRNYEYLYNHYLTQIRKLGDSEAAAAMNHTNVHGMGVNEHQTGLAVDFTDDSFYSSYFGDFTNDGFEQTETFAWLYEHCAEYGFIYRYPEDKAFYYGASCAEGHFRYVGKEAARYITENDLCLEEFLLLYDDEAVYQPDLWEAAGKHENKKTA